MIFSGPAAVREMLWRRKKRKEGERPQAYLRMRKDASDGGGDGTSSVGSATGLPAPNAGTVGSAPTFDVGKKRRRRRRTRVTKTAAFETGVKTAFSMAQGALALGGAGLGVLAIYDAMKARGYGKDIAEVQKAIQTGQQVDSRSFTKKIDPKIKVLWDKNDILQALMKEPTINNIVARLQAGALANAVNNGENAFALPGERGEYIFVRQRCNAQVLAHEIGHILDFRRQGLNIRNPGPYDKSLATLFWKPSYEKSTMTAEREAWRQAPGKKRKWRLEESALGTYDKGFHINRASFAGAGSILMLNAMRKMGQEMTAGEYERDVSAPGVTGMNPAPVQTSGRTERRSGNQGSKGVPEWLRILKLLPSKSTWGGGDAVNVPATDNQFEVPYAR